MKALRIHAFGGPEVLKMEDVPIPRPAADEVLVKVHATSINPIDWKIRKGASKGRFPITFPFTPGWDLSGVVEQAGSDVQRFKQGDEIYGRPDPTRNGTYAEYIVVRADEVNFKPQSVDHVHAAAIPLAGLTAWQGLFDQGQLRKGQRVLIQAASGGVGTFAVQFAHWKGAFVIGTTSEANIELVGALGADEVIDYQTENFEELLKDVDLVFDTLGGDVQKKSLLVLNNGGKLVTTVKPENQGEAEARDIVVKGYMAQSYPDQLGLLARLLDEGKFKPVISKIIGLDEVAEAHRASEQGHVRGKIAVKIV
ncbi:MAG TPA: NADP-dependent oxidoreductase [Chitinophagaceae bacterium]|nr:NADP-dependent oxidoreductase [Chitinophagaceae bacterium]